MKDKYVNTHFPPFKVLLKNSIASIFLMLAAFIINYSFNLLLARLLTAKEYGDVNITIAVIMICTPFLIVGANYAAMVFLSGYFINKDYSHAKGFLLWIKKRFFLGSLITIFIGSFGISLEIVLIKYNIVNAPFIHPAIFSFWIIPFSAAMLILTAITAAFQEYIFSSFSNKVLIYLFSMILIYVWSTSIGILNTYVAILCIGIAYIITVILQLIYLFFKIPESYYKAKFLREDKSWKSVSLQLFYTRLGYLISSTINLIMLEVLGTHKADVGNFAAILTILSVMQLTSIAFSFVLEPMIKPCFTYNRLKFLQYFLNIVNAVNVSALILFSLIIAIFGKELLAHFNPIFANAYDSLILSLIGITIYFLLPTSRAVLNFAGYTPKMTKILSYQVAIFLVLDCILIPRYNLFGVAIAMTSGYIFTSLMGLFYCKKYIKQLKTFFII